jgi:hypothetical protein
MIHGFLFGLGLIAAVTVGPLIVLVAFAIAVAVVEVLFVVVTALCLIVVVAKMLGASIDPSAFLLSTGWLVVAGIGCGIYFLHNADQAEIGATSLDSSERPDPPFA